MNQKLSFIWGGIRFIKTKIDTMISAQREYTKINQSRGFLERT